MTPEPITFFGGSVMNKITTGFLAVVVTGCLAAPLLTVQDAQAIPAFTRQHKTECFTCHTIFPELTEQGENFKKNSYVWIETKGHAPAAKKKDDKKEGKKGLNEKEYLELSSLPEFVPLSLVGTFNASWADNRSADTGNKFDLVTRAIVFDAGGSLNDKLGFWMSYNLYTSGPFDPVVSGSNMNANTPHNNTPDINEAYVQARHIFDSPVNLKVGRMRPDLSLWKGTNKTSIVSPMATTSFRVGDSPFYVDTPSDGLELNAIVKGRMFASAGVVKRKDQDTPDGFGSVQFKLGGADFDGREAPVNFDEESIFDYLTLTVGGYGYFGTNAVGANKQTNNYYRYGLESDIRYQRLRLKVASAFGTDDNAIILNSATNPAGGLWKETMSRVVAVEGLYLFGSTFIPSLRYEYEDTEVAVTRRYIPTLAYAALQNGKIVLEYKIQDRVGFQPANIINMTFTAVF
jgi:hypothetical protein